MTFTSVNEDTGSVFLCVRIFTNASFLPMNTNFSLDLFSVADSAGITPSVIIAATPVYFYCFIIFSFLLTNSDETDYIEINSSNNPLMAFTSNPSTHRQCFSVTIVSDSILEDVERFILNLSLAKGNIPVIVIPDVSVVEILDNDCK